MIVSVLFVVVGIVAFVYHFTDFFADDVKWSDVLIVELVRLVAIVCGVLLFMSVGWARWLAVVWLLYHVIIGAMHSPSEMIAHIVILLLIAVLLFVASSTRFFRRG